MLKKILTKGNKLVTLAAIITVILGSLMVVSAEMGNKVGNADYLTLMGKRQAIYAIAGLLMYFIVMNIPVYRFRITLYWIAYVIILALLLYCRHFEQVNGAYAWITIGKTSSVQPSEFAKVFMIAFAGKMLTVDRGEKNLAYFWRYGFAAFVYVFIIVVIQHDFGSGVVLFVICYCMMLIPGYKQLRRTQGWMLLFIIFGLIGIGVVMSKPFTEYLKAHSGNYMIARFLAAADPFLYQYDNGYHLIMSLVSFANGGISGLGYGNSIHKYMNFPNPSNDFILPVIVEETGILGFGVFLLLYGCMLIPLVRASLRSERLSAKIVLLGTFTYFIVHFILNIGGVSGLIPLTGVPLLMISSGGSSLVASLCALALAQSEIERSKS